MDLWICNIFFQALHKVKAEYEIVDGKLAIITPDRYEEAYAILAKDFIPYEPLAQAFGLTNWDECFKKMALEDLKKNLSVCMTSTDNGEIMGILITGVMNKTDPVMDQCYQEHPLMSIITFLNHKNKEVNFFERYAVDEAVHMFTLGVKKNYRRMGLGGRLLAASVAMCQELGFKAIEVEGTSNFSQKILEKRGFEILARMPYDSYCHNGRPIREGTGEHTMTKIYGMKL